MKSKLVFCSAIICITLCITPNTTVIAKSSSVFIPIAPYETLPASEISPLASDIGWKYKIINGVLYKRQYDFTKGKWIGNWIKA